MRLTFLIKIGEGLIPAIPKDNYLVPITNKRNINGNPKYKDSVRFFDFLLKYETNTCTPGVTECQKFNTVYRLFLRQDNL